MAASKNTANTFRVTLHGISPLLLHADDLSWRGQLERWNANPENKRVSKAGDDRTPAWRWIGYCYHDASHVGIAADNLMTTLREGGAKVPVPGKRNQTYKRQSPRPQYMPAMSRMLCSTPVVILSSNTVIDPLTDHALKRGRTRMCFDMPTFADLANNSNPRSCAACSWAS